jgi:type II secretory pathway component PulC
LIAVLAYFAALAANDIVSSKSRVADRQPQSVARSTEPAPSHSRSDYQAIVDRDIFNLEVKAPPPPPPVVENLHLKLIGISRMKNGKPFAIVDDRGVQSVYRVGEIIPESGRLVAVEEDRAIVEHDGRRMVVELPKDEIAGAPGLRRLRRAQPLDTEGPTSEVAQDETVPGGTEPDQAIENVEPEAPPEASEEPEPEQ